MLRVIRNRWTNRLGWVALGAALYAVASNAMDSWNDWDLQHRVSGRWILASPITSPEYPDYVSANVEYRPDGIYTIWHTLKDGSTRIFEYGHWRVADGRLMTQLLATEWRPIPSDAQTNPVQLIIVRADERLILVWPAGHQYSWSRAVG